MAEMPFQKPKFASLLYYNPWSYQTKIFSFTSMPFPENYVHWTETAETHIFSADLPGVRKEEIKVKVEDSIYLTIRTQRLDDDDDDDDDGDGDESTEARRNFIRKFRLPGQVDIERISARYEDGILTITVPRALRRGFFIEPAGMSERLEVLARAA